MKTLSGSSGASAYVKRSHARSVPHAASPDITCVAETDPEQWTADLGAGYDLAVRVKGVRDDGTTVIEGSINLWISPKKG